MHFFQQKFCGENLEPDHKADWLHAMWELGFHVIPCGSPKETVPQYFRSRHPFDTDDALKAKWAKTPRVKWTHYQTIQPSEEEIKQWHSQYPEANWAVITGIAFAVVDADSDEAVTWIESGGITRTPLKQITPRGGTHYFYALGPDDIRNSVGKNKIDVRGDGGYVMIAPSVGYRLECEQSYGVTSIDDLPLLSGVDLQHIHGFNSVDPNTGEVPSIREKLTEDPKVEGSRNDTLARLVGKWIKEGWGLREVLIKAQDWNQSCSPPMDLVEATKTVMSICQGHIKRNPDLAESGINQWNTSTWHTGLTEDLKEIQDQEDPIDTPQKPESGPLGLVPFSSFEWQSMEDDTIEQYWGDKFIFENSRVLLLGKPKIGKSNWLGAFAAGATTGTHFMGQPFSKPLKVMWFQAEIIAEFLKQRVEMYYQRFSTNDEVRQMGFDNLIISGRLRKNLMKDSDIQAFSDEVAFHNPDIVMIDPIINFFDGEENSNTEIRKLLDRVDMLMEMNNVATIIAHHTGKERADDRSFLSARGGSVFAGWFDSGIKLMGEKPNINIFYEARNAADPQEHISLFNFDDGLWEVSDFTRTPNKKSDEEVAEDEVEIAGIVMKAMKENEFYKRADLEFLAKTALKRHKKANGVNACQRAVTHVQKHLSHIVHTHSEPGMAMWHYLGTSTAAKPWKVEAEGAGDES